MLRAKISPAGQLLLRQVAHEGKATDGAAKKSAGSEVVKVLVTLSEGATVDDFADYNVDCKIGDKYVLIDMPLNQIEEMAESDAVKYVSFGDNRELYLDKAHAATGVDVVHAGGSGLPKAFNGEGVIAGLYDTGIDIAHAAFRGDDGSSYRIKRFINYVKDKTYDESNMSSATYDYYTATHATAVLGILAGRSGISGSYGEFGSGETNPKVSSGNIPYVGVAGKADIFIGAGALQGNNILSTCQKIVDYAKAENKPAVINLSLGTVLGPHDGSTSFCKALDEIAKEVPVFIASGNDGNRGCSINKTFTASDNKICTTLEPNSREYSHQILVYADNNKPLRLRIGIFSRTERYFIMESDINSSKTINANIDSSDDFEMSFGAYFTSDSKIEVVKGIDETGHYVVALNINVVKDNDSNKNGFKFLGFTFEGDAGTKVVATTDGSFENANIAEVFQSGNSSNSINDDATGLNTISVGSFISRTKFVCLDGYGYQDSSSPTVGDIAGSSSYGYSFDGRTFPAITAPGHLIVAPMNEFYFTAASVTDDQVCAKAVSNGRDNHWDATSGTSMACPYAAGVACLMLQANPLMKPEDVRKLMLESTTTDSHM
ncbi:MAG: S8 family serine peptidase, partial [Candidatus Limisoma sp.]